MKKFRTALADDFHVNMCQSSMLHPQLDRCSMREVEDSAIDVRPSVSDAHIDMLPVRQVDDSDDAAERHRAVSCRQSLHIVDFAVGRLPPMKRFTIPRGDSAILYTHVKSGIAFGNPGTSSQ